MLLDLSADNDKDNNYNDENITISSLLSLCSIWKKYINSPDIKISINIRNVPKKQVTNQYND